MKSLLRQIVAGPKKKTPYNGQQLDLTYITDRVIAMAYPASNFFEKAYRNSIQDVANYFNEYHKDNYLIINVSSRPYDYNFFNGRVRDYEWPDHQAPPITTLVQIAHEIKNYLQKRKNGVVAVHCNHGKGRTGTAIIGFFLYIGLYGSAQQALSFYNSRRFQSDTYGVDQPCQTRYLTYLQKLRKLPSIQKKMIAYKLVTVTQKGLHDKFYLSIKKTRNGQSIIGKFNFAQFSLIEKPLIGDLFIEVFEQAWSGPKKIARINYHPFFLNPSGALNVKQLTSVFKGNQIKLSKNIGNQFSIKLQFQYFCLCHVQGSQGIQCECTKQRQHEQKQWTSLVKHMDEVRNCNQKQAIQYFYYQSTQLQKIKQQEQLKNQEELPAQQIYGLNKNMSNLEIQKQPVYGKLINKKIDDSEDQPQKMENLRKDKDSSSSEDQQ